ncbi:MAG TPA: hypothetical protein VGL61_06520 [Kofleriaceae bacterium]|jgi:hypothetical protein
MPIRFDEPKQDLVGSRRLIQLARQVTAGHGRLDDAARTQMQWAVGSDHHDDRALAAAFLGAMRAEP